MCKFHQAHEIKYLSPCCIWYGENHGKTVVSSLYNEFPCKIKGLGNRRESNHVAGLIVREEAHEPANYVGWLDDGRPRFNCLSHYGILTAVAVLEGLMRPF